MVMSTSIALIDNLMVYNPSLRTSVYRKNNNFLLNSRIREGIGGRNRRILGLVVPNAKKKGLNTRKTKWWERFFFEEDGNWLGLREEDLEEDEFEVRENEIEDDDEREKVSEEEKFEAWKKRAEALIELREAQEGIRNEENRNWEDWLVFDEGNGGVKREWDYDDDDEVNELKEEDVDGDADEKMPERGLVKTIEDLILGKEDDDLLYEDRVFQFASRNSAKFLAVLIIIPWAMDFLVHDYVLMPFLDR
ncbi:Chloroplast envelope membrane protein [Bienertia sinuspersici]